MPDRNSPWGDAPDDIFAPISPPALPEPAGHPPRGQKRPRRNQVVAIAAGVAAIAVGVWASGVGRGASPPTAAPAPAPTAEHIPAATPPAAPAASPTSVTESPLPEPTATPTPLPTPTATAPEVTPTATTRPTTADRSAPTAEPTTPPTPTLMPDQTPWIAPTPIPVAEGQIKLLAGAPSGRCAHTLRAEVIDNVDAMGWYEWELCAWSGFRSDGRDPILPEAEAQALVDRIWAEIEVEENSKAGAPPIVVVGSDHPCLIWAVGCYSSSQSCRIDCYVWEHHINLRLDAPKKTVLHETAHALVEGHPTMRACDEQWREDPSGEGHHACLHGDIFRCAAERLYHQYAGIPPTGVCGTTNQQ